MFLQLKCIIFQLIYCILYIFNFKKNMISIIYSDSSTLYSNLREIEKQFIYGILNIKLF